jgi:uncharacterized membrane protein YhfC
VVPLISPVFLLPGTAMIALVAGSAWWWQRGKPSLRPAFWWGVVAWVASIALKSAASLPTMQFFYRHSNNPLIWLYIGVLTGMFECAVPLLLIAKTRLRQADWNQAVAFGIGFGGIEAFLMGLVGLVVALLLVVFPNQIPVSAREPLLKQFAHSSLAALPLPVIERVTAMVAHCLASVLIIYAVRRGQQRWFWLSFAYKTAIDGFAGWALLAWKLTSSTVKIAEFEAMVSVFALIAIWAMPKLKTGFNRLESVSVSAAVSPDPDGFATPVSPRATPLRR